MPKKFKHYAFVDKKLVVYVWAFNKTREEIRRHLPYGDAEVVM